jgi:hypothetical protein
MLTYYFNDNVNERIFTYLNSFIRLADYRFLACELYVSPKARQEFESCIGLESFTKPYINGYDNAYIFRYDGVDFYLMEKDFIIGGDIIVIPIMLNNKQ